MSSRIGRIIDMVLRVLGFVHANPSEDPAYLATVARLEERGTRLQVLAAQEQSGHIEARAAAINKVELRAQLGDILVLLFRLATTATREEPSIPVRFSIPRIHCAAHTFLTGCRVVLTEARAHQELLGRYGMPAGLLDRFGVATDQYEEAIKAKNSGTSAHVGANAEMEELAVEIVQLVRLLDAVNRPQFRSDPEKRAAWKSARQIVRSAPKPSAPTTPAGPDAGKPAA